MKLNITNCERIGLAAYMDRNWSATEDEIEALYSAYEAMKLADFAPFIKRDEKGDLRFSCPDELVSDEIATDIELTDAAVELIRKYYPLAPTPPQLGPAKARLLRKLRG